MDIRQSYNSPLSRRLRQALAVATRNLIESGFEDLCQIRNSSEMLPETELVVHLPGRFLTRYTPDFLRKFLVCIITVAWKLARPDQAELTCVGEALAAHALITEAELVLDRERQDLPFAEHFDAFEASLLRNIDIHRLFDADLYQIDDSQLNEKLDAIGLGFDKWFEPVRDATNEGNVIIHPYLRHPAT